jgi:CHASE3 domain sensor protein
VDAKLANMSQVIELRRRDGLMATLAAATGGQGKLLMDSIRAGMRGFIQTEDEALAQRDAALQSSTRNLYAKSEEFQAQGRTSLQRR